MVTVTVRQFIRGWQLCEWVILFLLILIVTGQPWPVSLLLSVCAMLALRALIIGLVAGAVALRFGAAPVSWSVFLRYWLEETLAFTLLYAFYQAVPRRWVSADDPVTDHHVILVHGFLCNDGLWFRLIPELRKAGLSVSTVEMSQAFASINRFSSLIDTEIQRVRAACPETRLSVVAFSMGGLAARQLPVSVQQQCELLTVYSPHSGTLLARLAALVAAKNGQQMCPGSTWLQQLNAKTPDFKRQMGIWTAHDTIVLPAVNSRPPFAERMRSGHGHLSAAIDKELHRDIVAWLVAD